MLKIHLFVRQQNIRGHLKKRNQEKSKMKITIIGASAGIGLETVKRGLNKSRTANSLQTLKPRRRPENVRDNFHKKS